MSVQNFGEDEIAQIHKRILRLNDVTQESLVGTDISSYLHPGTKKSKEEEASSKQTKTTPKIIDSNVVIIRSTQRYDAYGNKISKFSKKQRVSFIDELNPNNALISTVKIHSTKEYNRTHTYPVKKNYKEKETCSCIIM